MASLTEVLAANNAPPTQDVDIAGNLKEGISAGIQLATAKEQIEEKKLKVAEQKEQLEISKFNSFNGMIKTLNLAKPAIAKQMAPKIKERFQAMGFDPAIIDTVMADPEFGRAIFNISSAHGSEISSNPESRAKALMAYQDLGLLSDGINNIQDMQKQSAQNKFAMEQQGRQIQGQKEVAAIGAEKHKGSALEKHGDNLRIARSKLTTQLSPIQDSLDQFSKVDALIEGGGMANAAGQRIVAMGLNKGALSESDAKLFQGNRSMMERFQQLATTAYDGKLTEDNQKELKEIVKVMKAAAQKRIDATIKDEARSFAKTYKVDAAEVEDIFTPYETAKLYEEKPKEGAAPKYTAEQFRAKWTGKKSPEAIEAAIQAAGLK